MRRGVLGITIGWPRSASPAAAAAAGAALLCVAAPAQAATVVAHGHTPDAVTDRDGTTHLVWSEYRAQRTTDTNSAGQRVDIVHYCKIPRGSTSCSGDKAFTDCVLPDDQLPDAG